MKFKLEDFIKDHHVATQNIHGSPENLEYGQRSGTIQKRVEKLIIDAGDEGVTVQDVVSHTGLKREQVMNAIYRNECIKLVPGRHKYGNKRYRYEV